MYEDIKKIKPFFEQLTWFFIFLISFIVIDALKEIAIFTRYTIIVLLTGWAIALIIQELYLYNIFKPILLGKQWEKIVIKKNSKKKK